MYFEPFWTIITKCCMTWEYNSIVEAPREWMEVSKSM